MPTTDMRFIKYLILFSSSLISLGAVAQASTASVESFQKDYQIHITKITEPIKLDGEFSEATWATLDTTSSFWRKFPTDIGRPERRTTISPISPDFCRRTEKPPTRSS